MSNMLGGLSYFHGSAKYRRETDPKYSYQEHFPTSLFTAVPSRSAFPRGFIWDEAFHNLLILRWNENITMDILSSYLNMMDVDGWIARESILGKEAEHHVPKEFIVQYTNHANPPAWLLLIDQFLSLANTQSGRDEHEERVKSLSYWLIVKPRLIAYLKWFVDTQGGLARGSFRWRGRDEATQDELNPKTLTSGLDDYPRASHPNTQERHVDLLAWMIYGEKVLKTHFDADLKISAGLSAEEMLESLHVYSP